MGEKEIRPSTWFYVLAIVVFVVGMTACTYIVVNVMPRYNDYIQVVAPAEGDIAFMAPGKYTIYYEYHTTVNGKVYATGENLSGLTCTLIDPDTRYHILLKRPSVSSKYNLDGREGIAILEFKLDKPGIYGFSALYDRRRTGPEVVLAISQISVGGIMFTVFGILAILFFTMAVSILIVAIAAVKRSKAKKRIAAASSAALPEKENG